MMRRTLCSGALLIALFCAMALAVTPRLHERVHKADPNHECVATLIASGKYQQSDAPVLAATPRPPLRFSKLPTLNPSWVPTAFLRASIFEHAPPAFS